MQAVSKQAEAVECIRCHAEAVSPTTGVAISEEWQGSRHARANAAGCVDCHEPASGHPNSCGACHGGGGTPTGYEVSRNPDGDGNCGKCHGVQHPGDVLLRRAPQHFGNISASVSSAGLRASYVSGQYAGRCRACHNPHNIDVTPQHRAYASSAHGDPHGLAWSNRDFKATPACIRCHTSTGFKQYVAGFTVPTAGFGAAGDLSREVLACDACHTSYAYGKGVRKIGAVSAPYGNTVASFPEIGGSNLCIPCHAGRAGSETINAISDFTKASFVNSHYLAASGLMYMKIGFTNFTSPSAATATSTYGKSLSPDDESTPGGVAGGISSAHRKLGTPLINGDNHNPGFFVSGVLDQNGPCVTCHLNASGVAKRAASGHSLKIDANAYRQVCVKCHDSENGVPFAADGSDFEEHFLKPQAEAFEDALHLMQSLLARYGISFANAHPYFYDDRLPLKDGKKQAVKDWTREGTVDGRKLMGACFNFNLLEHEPAAYVHARSYTRRLIYDSIDFLDDGIMNLSTGATALASGLTRNGAPIYVKDASAYNTSGGAISTIYGNTSEAMLYLIGWSRRTGQWSAFERP